jgi:hypothetical protein
MWAAGQVIGARLFAQLYAQAGAPTALMLFFAPPLLMMLVIRR